MERNLHYDEVHITTEWASSLNIDCNDVSAIKANDIRPANGISANGVVRDLYIDVEDDDSLGR